MVVESLKHGVELRKDYPWSGATQGRERRDESRRGTLKRAPRHYVPARVEM